MAIGFSTLHLGNGQVVSEIRAEQDGDRRVVAAVAVIVLLMLVVAGIVAVAATAYRDTGAGGEQAAEVPPAPSTQPAGEEPPAPSNQPGNTAAGANVFADNCSGCHGTDGHGGNGGPDLAGADNLQAVITQVTNGGGGMPPFSGTLTDKEIRDVAAFVTQRVAT